MIPQIWKYNERRRKGGENKYVLSTLSIVSGFMSILHLVPPLTVQDWCYCVYFADDDRVGHLERSAKHSEDGKSKEQHQKDQSDKLGWSFSNFCIRITRKLVKTSSLGLTFGVSVSVGLAWGQNIWISRWFPAEINGIWLLSSVLILEKLLKNLFVIRLWSRFFQY